MTTRLWPHGDPSDVARAIVADPRFAGRSVVASAQRTWLDVAREWVLHWLRNLLHSLDRALGARNPFETAIGFVAIGAALLLIAYAAYAAVRLYRRRRRHAHANVAVQSAGGAERDSAALREAAFAAARDGRLRDAAGLLFLAAVRALDERGRVTYDAARTPGEYRRIVGDPVFDALATDAVTALFAAAEPRAELFERMQASYARFFDPAR